MYPAPGLLVVWSGTRPRSELHAIPDGGLVFGRAVLAATDDDRISREHVRISRELAVTDLGSHNGTFGNGQRLAANAVTAARPHAVLRIGRTVLVLLGDVRSYEAQVVDGELATGRRTATLHAELDRAALDRAHLLIRGEPGSGRGHLARRYAAKLPSARLLEDPYLDKEALVELIDAVACDPDLRLVITQNLFASPFRPQLDALMKSHAHRIELPALRERPDELATIIDRGIHVRNPTLTCHATLIEHVLLRQDGMMQVDDNLYLSARAYTNQIVRGEDYDRAMRSRWAIQGA